MKYGEHLEIAPIGCPWGEITYCERLYNYIFSVKTAEGGGIMVCISVADEYLLPEAQKCGFKHGEHLCFEMETQANIIIRELLDKRIWKIPPRVKNMPEFEKNLNASLKKFHPDYWAEREELSGNTKFKKEFFDKLDKELSDFKCAVLNSDKITIFGLAENISAMMKIYEHFKNDDIYNKKDLEFLLDFENPLAFIAEKLIAYQNSNIAVFDCIIRNINKN